MRDKLYTHRLALAALALIALAGCGGGGADSPAQEPGPDAPPTLPAPSPPPPLAPSPLLTYTPNATVCSWMAEHIKPFVWPAHAWGPRSLPPVVVRGVATPIHNAEGLAQYEVTSTAVVLHAHYYPDIQAKNLPFSPAQLWAQEASCKHNIEIIAESMRFPGFGANSWSAFMHDDIANHLAKEEYTYSVAQVPKPDPCRPGVVFGNGTPLPPGCTPNTP